MLTLTRQEQERIVVIPPGSGPVWVTVIEVVDGVVRIGFQADADTEIHREEVWEAIQRDGRRRTHRPDR